MKLENPCSIKPPEINSAPPVDPEEQQTKTQGTNKQKAVTGSGARLSMSVPGRGFEPAEQQAVAKKSKITQYHRRIDQTNRTKSVSTLGGGLRCTGRQRRQATTFVRTRTVLTAPSPTTQKRGVRLILAITSGLRVLLVCGCPLPPRYLHGALDPSPACFIHTCNVAGKGGVVEPILPSSGVRVQGASVRRGEVALKGQPTENLGLFGAGSHPDGPAPGGQVGGEGRANDRELVRLRDRHGPSPVFFGNVPGEGRAPVDAHERVVLGAYPAWRARHELLVSQLRFQKRYFWTELNIWSTYLMFDDHGKLLLDRSATVFGRCARCTECCCRNCQERILTSTQPSRVVGEQGAARDKKR